MWFYSNNCAKECTVKDPKCFYFSFFTTPRAVMKVAPISELNLSASSSSSGLLRADLTAPDTRSLSLTRLPGGLGLQKLQCQNHCLLVITASLTSWTLMLLWLEGVLARVQLTPVRVQLMRWGRRPRAAPPSLWSPRLAQAERGISESEAGGGHPVGGQTLLGLACGPLVTPWARDYCDHGDLASGTQTWSPGDQGRWRTQGRPPGVCQPLLMVRSRAGRCWAAAAARRRRHQRRRRRRLLARGSWRGAGGAGGRLCGGAGQWWRGVWAWGAPGWGAEGGEAPQGTGGSSGATWLGTVTAPSQRNRCSSDNTEGEWLMLGVVSACQEAWLSTDIWAPGVPCCHLASPVSESLSVSGDHLSLYSWSLTTLWSVINGQRGLSGDLWHGMPCIKPTWALWPLIICISFESFKTLSSRIWLNFFYYFLGLLNIKILEWNRIASMHVVVKWQNRNHKNPIHRNMQ